MSRLALRLSVVFVLTAVAFLRGPIAFVHADISSDVDQEGSSDSGDAVGGQVVGVSSSGDASIDSTNRSEDVDVSTGDASGSNTHDGTVRGSTGVDLLEEVIATLNDIGVDIPEDASREEVIAALMDITGTDTEEELLEFLEQIPDVPPEEIEGLAAFLQGDEFVGSDADVDASTDQSGSVSTGDAIAGQAVGVVTSLAATADLVLSNESLDTDADSGDADLTNVSDTTVVASPK